MPPARYQKINAHYYRHIRTVGDVHGDYQLLQSRLHQLSFYPETDLLTSVGDNIDRGPKSLNAPRLLNQPWFISVKDNHEAVAFDVSEAGDGNMWLASGGGWFFGSNGSERQEAIDLLLKPHHLPHITEITNDTIKYVIAHADYPGKGYQFGKEMTENELLWLVGRVQESLNSELQKINGVDFLISGHTAFDNIQTLTDQIYIDIGSLKDGRLSFYKIR